MGSSACLSRVQGHWVRRGKGLEWARTVKVAMLVWYELCPGHSQLPNKPCGPHLNATLPFWKPNFAEWDRTLEWELSAGRLTALVLGYGRFATQTSHHTIDVTASSAQSIQPIGVLFPRLWFLPTYLCPTAEVASLRGLAVIDV